MNGINRRSCSKQREARHRMASHRHTLMILNGWLEENLATTTATLFTATGLRLRPDVTTLQDEAPGYAFYLTLCMLAGYLFL